MEGISEETLNAVFQRPCRDHDVVKRLRDIRAGLALAIKATRKASEYLVRQFCAAHKSLEKPDGTLAIPEDIVAQEIMLSHFRSWHPHDGILAEEGVREGLEQGSAPAAL